MLQSMGLQRVGHDWTTEQQQQQIIRLASLLALKVKNLPEMKETQVRSLGQEDLLKKKMTTHSSILAWKIPRTEEPSRLECTGLHRVGRD